MKKLFLFFAAASLFFTLEGCKGTGSSTEKDAFDTITEEQISEQDTISANPIPEEDPVDESFTVSDLLKKSHGDDVIPYTVRNIKDIKKTFENKGWTISEKKKRIEVWDGGTADNWEEDYETLEEYIADNTKTGTEVTYTLNSNNLSILIIKNPSRPEPDIIINFENKEAKNNFIKELNAAGIYEWYSSKQDSCMGYRIENNCISISYDCWA
ncbi:MAG: hypothetical protein J1E38_10265 [Paramuribaculum sp.]|nr:hypothetical protein [Paramuribaculum sp.]